MTDEGLAREVRELKRELRQLRGELARFVERSNEDYLKGLLEGARRDFDRILAEHLERDVALELDHRISKDCHRSRRCVEDFSSRLGGMPALCEASGTEAALEAKYTEFRLLEESLGPECAPCIGEAFATLNKEADALRALGLYRERMEEKGVRDLSVELMQEILGPMANPTRLSILKALYTESKNFSALSEISGLRSGNLLFHLRILTRAGLAVQKQERGDYMITKKGRELLEGLAGMGP